MSDALLELAVKRPSFEKIRLVQEKVGYLVLSDLTHSLNLLEGEKRDGEQAAFRMQILLSTSRCLKSIDLTCIPNTLGGLNDKAHRS